MAIYVLDTNVVSELMKPQLDINVKQWFESIAMDVCLTTAITVAEITHGIARLPAGRKREQLSNAFGYLVGTEGSIQVLDVSESAARLAGEFCAVRTTISGSFDMPDMLIAGLAAKEGAIIVTRNPKDFTGLPVATIDPW